MGARIRWQNPFQVKTGLLEGLVETGTTTYIS